MQDVGCTQRAVLMIWISGVLPGSIRSTGRAFVELTPQVSDKSQWYAIKRKKPRGRTAGAGTGPCTSGVCLSVRLLFHTIYHYVTTNTSPIIVFRHRSEKGKMSGVYPTVESTIIQNAIMKQRHSPPRFDFQKTHIHTRTHTRTRTHAHTHTRTHASAHTHPHDGTYIHKRHQVSAACFIFNLHNCFKSAESENSDDDFSYQKICF